MVKTTREQRLALKRVYDRGPIFGTHQNPAEDLPLTYKEFRKEVQPTFLMDNAVIVKWCGMWLAIETDGYTHS